MWPFCKDDRQICEVVHIFGKQKNRVYYCIYSFPGGASDKEPTCQFRRHNRHRFDPWVGKIPWRRKQQPTLVFLPGELHGERSLAGCRVRQDLMSKQ